MSKINDAQKRAWLKKCSRTDINRWLWVRVQGAPFERGFQYGSLTAKEYAEAVRVYAAMTIETAGKDLAFFRDKAVELQIYPELLDLFILAAMWKRSRICRARGHSGEPESAGPDSSAERRESAASGSSARASRARLFHDSPSYGSGPT